MGAPRKLPPAEELLRLRRTLKVGVIATRYGVLPSSVTQALHRAGWRGRPRRRRSVKLPGCDVTLWAAYLECGRNTAELGRRYGCSTVAAWKRVDALKKGSRRAT